MVAVTSAQRMDTLRHRKPLHRFTCMYCRQVYESPYPGQRVCNDRVKAVQTGKLGDPHCREWSRAIERATASDRYFSQRYPGGVPIWWREPIRIKHLRHRLGMDQQAFAALIGQTQQQLSRTERGLNKIKKQCTLDKLDELWQREFGDDTQKEAV